MQDGCEGTEEKSLRGQMSCTKTEQRPLDRKDSAHGMQWDQTTARDEVKVGYIRALLTTLDTGYFTV